MFWQIICVQYWTIGVTHWRISKNMGELEREIERCVMGTQCKSTIGMRETLKVEFWTHYV